jgi:site-specific DNA-methyltransferase (adenine-specific)
MSSEVRLAFERSPQVGIKAPKLRSILRGDDGLRWVRGDNAQALRALLPELEAQVTLAYLDPPFLTGRVHSRIQREREAANNRILRTTHAAFDDRWDSMSAYLDALHQRLPLIRDTLADHGSAVIHVDSKTSHYVKVLCDEVFGEEAFASEIIWRYRRWPAKTPNFQRVHDVLLRYVKNPAARPRFNQLYEPLAPSTLATWGKKKQRAVVGEDGRRVRSNTTEEATPGAPMGDVWEIGIVAPVARERTGYPTQKPQALLERLILSLTDPGDLVLDPYAGSGTTVAVAALNNRRALGIDQSDEAWRVAETRLAAIGRVTCHCVRESVARAS